MIEYKYYIAVFIGSIIISFLITRWRRKGNFETKAIKKGDIIHNMSENTRHVVSKHEGGEISLMAKRIVNLPKEYSPREMQFIESEYMEEGIKQLKQSNQRECFILNDRSLPGTKFVNVTDIQVNFKARNNKTLKIEDKQEIRTVKLLLLNEWIT
jgi:hypothetical protein